MAFLEKDALQGAPDSYRLSSTVKKYTLRDNGFEPTKNGNFQFNRNLELGSGPSPKLKMTVTSDLSKFTLSAVTANGLREINLYKGETFADARKRAEQVLTGFVEAGILEKI